MRQRAVKVKLNISENEKSTLLQTMKIFSDVFNFYSAWSSQNNNSTSKLKAHKETYQQTKSMFHLPSALIQSARDMALESCKNKRKKHAPKKKQTSSIRYDQRTFTLRGEQLTISSIEKRIKTIIKLSNYSIEYFNSWKLLKTGYLSLQGKNLYFTFLFEKEAVSNKQVGKIVGLDRGIINTIATSEGILYTGKALRKNKRKHMYLKRRLQAKGTRSARKRLKGLSGKEKRFSDNFLHCMAKNLANDTDVSTYVLENLTKIKSKKYNNKSNKIVSNWGFKRFETLLKYKTEASGIKIEFVDARFTSQICSCCGMIDKQARNKGIYTCSRCCLTIHSDINAAINIRNRYIFEQQSFPNETLGQGAVNHPNVNDFQESFSSSQPCAVSS
jgi:putative transposase